MNQLRWILIILMLQLAAAQTWALSGARLINQSKSGQTALFNLGIHDGIKEGDFAVIVKEIRSLDRRDLRLVPVARARNIKIATGQSVWILYKIFDQELLVKGDPYLVLSESQMLRGRRDPHFGRITIITEDDKRALRVQKALTDDKDRLSKLKEHYPELEVMHERESRTDKDGTLYDVDAWKKVGRDKYRTAIYKSPHQDDFRRQLRLSTFEKLVTAYIKKINDPNFNYDQFYEEQMKGEFANQFRKKTNFDTEYERFLANQSSKAIEDAKLYRTILEKGDAWSQDFSDEELKLVLNQVSVLQEKDRRALVLADPKRFSLYFSYGMNVTDAQNDKDPSYYRQGAYSLDLELEGTPVLKHETLERFTLSGSVRTNHSAIEASGQNAKLDEVSVALGVNWYPYFPPHAIEAPAIFLGAFVRSGTARVESPSLAQKSNYTLLTIPGLRGGMKYNFKNKIGLRLAFSLERMLLDRYEQSTFGSVLPDQANLVEGKMNFALAYSF
jgi:hypothetical protein